MMSVEKTSTFEPRFFLIHSRDCLWCGHGALRFEPLPPLVFELGDPRLEFFGVHLVSHVALDFFASDDCLRGGGCGSGRG